jgi:hypothetical protein
MTNEALPQTHQAVSAPESSALSELTAMRTCYDALKGLPVDAIARATNWLAATFQIGGQAPSARNGPAVQRSSSTPSAPIEDPISKYSDLPSFFAATQPEVQTDKALVVAAWLQVAKNIEDLDSQQINTELKHLGHGLLNITRALDSLIASRPALMIQTRKEGTSQQARKRFKVTVEGMNRVKGLLIDQNENGTS